MCAVRSGPRLWVRLAVFAAILALASSVVAIAVGLLALVVAQIQRPIIPASATLQERYL